MKKEIAQKIMVSLSMDFLRALIEYADEQIELTNITLQTSGDQLTIQRAQGYITAMRNLKRIRDDAVAVMENEVGRKVSDPKIGKGG